MKNKEIVKSWLINIEGMPEIQLKELQQKDVSETFLIYPRKRLCSRMC